MAVAVSPVPPAGVLPVPADEQEAVRWPAVDQARQVGQDGQQGVYACVCLFCPPTLESSAVDPSLDPPPLDLQQMTTPHALPCLGH